MRVDALGVPATGPVLTGADGVGAATAGLPTSPGSPTSPVSPATPSSQYPMTAPQGNVAPASAVVSSRTPSASAPISLAAFSDSMTNSP